MGEKNITYKVLIEDMTERTTSKEKWEGNTKLDFKEIVWGHVGRVNQAQGQVTVVGPYEHDEAISGSIKCLEFLEYGLFRNSYLATWSSKRILWNFLVRLMGKNILNNIKTTSRFKFQSVFETFSIWQAFKEMRGEMLSELCVPMDKF